MDFGKPFTLVADRMDTSLWGQILSLVTNACLGKPLSGEASTGCCARGGLNASSHAVEVVTWLILPVVICLSQRLSHACLSINKFVL
jgi:hypothetical protein